MKASIHRHTSPGDVSTVTSFEFGENWFTCPLVIGAWMHQCVHLPSPYKVLIRFPFPSLQFFFFPGDDKRDLQNLWREDEVQLRKQDCLLGCPRAFILQFSLVLLMHLLTR